MSTELPLCKCGCGKRVERRTKKYFKDHFRNPPESEVVPIVIVTSSAVAEPVNKSTRSPEVINPNKKSEVRDTTFLDEIKNAETLNERNRIVDSSMENDNLSLGQKAEILSTDFIREIKENCHDQPIIEPKKIIKVKIVKKKAPKPVKLTKKQRREQLLHNMRNSGNTSYLAK